MRNNKKNKRRRPFDRAALYNNRLAPQIDNTQESIEKCITKAEEEDKTVKESRIRYLDDIIKELDGLIISEEPRIAVVSPSGESLAMLHNMIRRMEIGKQEQNNEKQTKNY